MSMIDVTVVIPTFNRLALLKEALASVYQQTISPVEIIVVDDGSTDETFDWLQTQKNLTVLRQVNRGPAAARNFGVQHAKSTWIAFLDSDDYWLSQKLERQGDFITKNAEVKILQTEEIWYRNGVRVNAKNRHAKPSGPAFLACLPLCVVSPSAVMMKRSFFWEVGGFDESFPACEDYELWLRVSLKSPIFTLREPLIVKRGGHSDQLSKKFWGMDRFRVRALEKTLLSQDLAREDKASLLKELFHKLGILAKGFEKRFSEQGNPYLEKILWLKKTQSNDSTGVAPTNYAQ